MERHRLLMQAIVVLVLAVVANVTSSDRLTAEAPSGSIHCVACFIVDNECDGNEDFACQQACDDADALGECQEYRPGEVECQTEPGQTVYNWVLCDDAS